MYEYIVILGKKQFTDEHDFVLFCFLIFIQSVQVKITCCNRSNANQFYSAPIFLKFVQRSKIRKYFLNVFLVGSNFGEKTSLIFIYIFYYY